MPITELSQEQEERLAAVCRDWLNVSLCTLPADRDAAEYGIRLAYESEGRMLPRKILWAGSPLAAVILLWEQLGEERLPPQAELRWETFWPSVFQRLDHDSWHRKRRHAYDTEAIDSLRDSFRSVHDPALATLGRLVTNPSLRNWERVWICALLPSGRLDQDCYGQHQAVWFAYLDGVKKLDPAYEHPFVGHALATRSLGCWFQLEDVAICSERPELISRDPDGWVHSDEGPALRYPDGFSVHAIHGVVCSEQVVLRPETLDAHQIRKIRNRRLRRMLVERIGADRYVQKVGARMIDQEELAILYAACFWDDERVVVLRDMTGDLPPTILHGDGWDRVPPDTRTIRDAVEWLRAREFRPYRPELLQP